MESFASHGTHVSESPELEAERVRFMEAMAEEIAEIGQPEEWMPAPVLDDNFTLLARGVASESRRTLKTQCVLDVAIEDAIVLLRPEVKFHARRPEADPMITSCKLERVYAPGDAVASLRVRMEAAAIGGMVESIARASKAVKQKFWHNSEADAGTMGVVVRMRTRRDFPREGHHSALIAPCNPKTFEPLNEYSLFKANLLYLEPHAEPGKTVVHAVRQVGNMPNWVEKLAATKMSKLALRFLNMRLEQFREFMQMPLFRELVEEGSQLYTVVSLRRSSRGTPLLPTARPAGSDGDWTWDWEARTDTRNDGRVAKTPLPEYLRELFDRLGIRDVEVFDSLDGWKVVPYQAVLRRSDWDHAWAAVEKPWQEQRAAYRKFFGGAYAPELAAGDKPRFQRSRGMSGDLRPKVKTFVYLPREVDGFQMLREEAPGKWRVFTPPALESLGVSYLTTKSLVGWSSLAERSMQAAPDGAVLQGEDEGDGWIKFEIEVDAPCDTESMAASESTAPPEDAPVPIRGTFIHFKTKPVMAGSFVGEVRPRSDSAHFDPSCVPDIP